MPSLPYTPPLEDMLFNLHQVFHLEELLELQAFSGLSPELIDQVLEEGGKFAASVLDPLNPSGDHEGSKLVRGKVQTASGFRSAYKAFTENGWNGAGCSVELGGQGLPHMVTTVLSEMWNAANMSFALCPMLTQGAIELLETHGAEEQKQLVLEKLVSGRWTGTMCMTEPQAGSDVGAVRTTATPEGGHYRIRGTKIFITWGEHDFTENIIHMVLARLPDAPEGVRGLSLFMVPKILINEDGSLGTPNEVQCVSIEQKMGIHASPTCVMSFGEEEGAVGTLIGEPNQGIQAMFTMMNAARLAVGLEGIGIAERATRLAIHYAGERVQGHRNREPATIDRHPGVRRTLWTMKAHTEALRGLALLAARGIDLYRHHASHETRQDQQHFVDLLIPVIKAHSTNLGFEIASLSMQVHGGVGYIEETGISQLLRDVRVAMIYEGTNGIQAKDLAGRKIRLEDGRAVTRFLHRIKAQTNLMSKSSREELKRSAGRLDHACGQLEQATGYLLNKADKDTVEICAETYLRLFGLVCEGYILAMQSLAADQAMQSRPENLSFLEQKIFTAGFFMREILPETEWLCKNICETQDSLPSL